MNNHYETLGVAKNADIKIIKSAYKKLAKIHHPDTHPDDPHAATRMSMINAAYEVLSDPEKREHYDATGEDKKQDTELAAHGHFLQAMGNVLQQRGGDVHLFEHVKLALQNDIQMANVNLEQGEQLVAGLRKAIKRIRYKGDRENIASRMLNEKITELQEKIAGARRGREIVTRALLIAEDYEYDYEEPQRRTGTTWGGSVHWTTTGS